MADSAAAANPQQDAAYSPGRRLREERERLGLNIETVASELRLTSSVIHALEEGDHSQLPPAAFVNGYIRSYARLVGLPPELLNPSSQNDSEETSEDYVSTTWLQSEMRSSDLLVRTVSILVILGLIVLLYIWADSRQIDTLEPHATPSGDAQPPLAVSPPVAPPATLEPRQPSEEVLPTQPIGTVDERVEGQAAGDGIVAQLEPVVGQESPEEPKSPEEPEPPVEEPALPVEPGPPIVDEPVATDTAPAPEQSQSAATQSLPGTSGEGTDELRLVLTDDSWIEIRDGSGVRIAFGMYRAGKSYTLRGKAPFDLLLGYASGVALYYNGQLFDHGPYRRRATARFILNGQGD